MDDTEISMSYIDSSTDTDQSETEISSDVVDNEQQLMSSQTRPRVNDVIDSIGDFEDAKSSYQNSSTTLESTNIFIPEWMFKRSNVVDALPQIRKLEEPAISVPIKMVASMRLEKDAECYNMSHKNRGKCLVFNHDVFEDSKYENREGSIVDAKRIHATFENLGFEVEILNNFKHGEVIDKITKISFEDHSDNDCVCVFVLTHGFKNNYIKAKDVAYSIEHIWKPFTADKCNTLAGKPKLFFFQACRGEKFDPGIMITARSETTQTDYGSLESYKIPTHSDFLIAQSSVEGFCSWRNREEGTWYVQSLCNVIDAHAKTTDLMRMLTITARKVATEYESFNDINPAKHEQKQVPSTTSMLTRDLYFLPKK